MPYEDRNLASDLARHIGTIKKTEAKTLGILSYLALQKYLSPYGLAYFISKLNNQPADNELLKRDPKEQGPIAQALLRLFAEVAPENVDLESLVQVFVDSDVIHPDDQPQLITAIQQNKINAEEYRQRTRKVS